jgi:hypothetical protein
MLCICYPLAEACKFELVKTEIFDLFRAGRALENAFNEAFNEAFTEAFKEAFNETCLIRLFKVAATIRRSIRG